MDIIRQPSNSDLTQFSRRTERKRHHSINANEYRPGQRIRFTGKKVLDDDDREIVGGDNLRLQKAILKGSDYLGMKIKNVNTYANPERLSRRALEGNYQAMDELSKQIGRIQNIVKKPEDRITNYEELKQKNIEALKIISERMRSPEIDKGVLDSLRTEAITRNNIQTSINQEIAREQRQISEVKSNEIKKAQQATFVEGNKIKEKEVDLRYADAYAKGTIDPRIMENVLNRNTYLNEEEQIEYRKGYYDKFARYIDYGYTPEQAKGKAIREMNKEIDGEIFEKERYALDEERHGKTYATARRIAGDLGIKQKPIQLKNIEGKSVRDIKIFG